VPSYQLTIEVPRHGGIQIDLSHGIFGHVGFYVLHVGRPIDKDLGLDMVVWQWMLFDSLVWWTYLTLFSQFKIWVVNVGSILKTHLKIFFLFFLAIVSLPLFCLHFCCVNKRSFCMFARKMLVLPPSLKL
jgi:hypothetical protein